MRRTVSKLFDTLLAMADPSAPVTLEYLQKFVEQFAGAAHDYPFGEQAQVWKVAGKMFALIGVDTDPVHLSLKCDPDLALELRAEFPDSISGAYHMNKKHWNTIVCDETVPAYDIEDWIGHSYDLVVAALPRAAREALPSD